MMSTFTIPTESSYIEAEGVRFAYRKFGQETGIPLVFFIHFRGTMENWDPRLLELWLKIDRLSFSIMPVSVNPVVKLHLLLLKWLRMQRLSFMHLVLRKSMSLVFRLVGWLFRS